ncbi:MAG: hypothetical protein ACK4VO_00220 [Pseudobdellovibrio sp.]
MEEFKFVLKCFVFACLIMVFSQTKVQNETLENKASHFLQHSELAYFIRSSADGGVKIINQTYEYVRNYVNEKFDLSSKSNGRPIYSSRSSPKKEKAQQGGAAEPLGGQSNLRNSSQLDQQDQTYLEEDRF